MANIEESKGKVIWTNPEVKTDPRIPKSFRLPESTINAIDRVAALTDRSQADVIIGAIHAYSMNFLSISEKAKELKELIDNQVNDLDYNRGEKMSEEEYNYRQMLFKWSEELEKFEQ